MANSSALVLSALLIGLLMGFLLSNRLSASAKQRKQIGDKLRQAKEEQAIYERKVAEHFVRTSDLVNNLTESYRSLHQHLASGADTLAGPNVSQDQGIAKADQLELDISNLPSLEATEPEPPKDYAPSQGVLDESYGLNKASSAEQSKADENKDKPQLSVVSNDEIDSQKDDDPTLKVG